jgi:hypothetical protein
MVILRRQSNTAAGFCENPDAIDNLVRDLEESDCPVDGAARNIRYPNRKTLAGRAPYARLQNSPSRYIVTVLKKAGLL